jgi:hypothetical protein
VGDLPELLLDGVDDSDDDVCLLGFEYAPDAARQVSP